MEQETPARPTAAARPAADAPAESATAPDAQAKPAPRPARPAASPEPAGAGARPAALGRATGAAATARQPAEAPPNEQPLIIGAILTGLLAFLLMGGMLAATVWYLLHAGPPPPV